jgi:hypothetical protein
VERIECQGNQAYSLPEFYKSDEDLLIGDRVCRSIRRIQDLGTVKPLQEEEVLKKGECS